MFSCCCFTFIFLGLINFYQITMSVEILIDLTWYKQRHTKLLSEILDMIYATPFVVVLKHMRNSQIQINMRIRAVKRVFLASVDTYPIILWADSEGTDQTARMPE